MVMVWYINQLKALYNIAIQIYKDNDLIFEVHTIL